jgi:RNA polymerase sigma-70 factor (ECF subfamily)
VNDSLEKSWNDVASNLRGYIRSRVRDHFTAEDILQDVYVKAHTRLSETPAPPNLQSWLYLVTKDAIIDHHRKTKPSEPVDDTFIDETADPGSKDDDQLKASFRRMIATLPEPYREAVILTELEGLSQKALAEHLGISLSGAKSRVQRGRELLKKDLLECCEFEFDRRGKVIDYIPKTDCCDRPTPASP